MRQTELSTAIHFEHNKLAAVVAALRNIADNSQVLSDEDCKNSNILFGCIWTLEDILPRLFSIHEELDMSGGEV